MSDLVKQATGIVEEFNRRFFDIPFGNSEFQNVKFIIESQYTPARGYRAAGLRLNDRLKALKECEFALRLKEIDILQIQKELRDKGLNPFDRMRKEVELEKAQCGKEETAKLVNDAAIECSILWREIKKFPEYTREQFEAEERQHFIISLSRQTRGLSGASDALDVITDNNDEFEQMRLEASQLMLEDSDV